MEEKIEMWSTVADIRKLINDLPDDMEVKIEYKGRQTIPIAEVVDGILIIRNL